MQISSENFEKDKHPMLKLEDRIPIPIPILKLEDIQD
jgi:hypothetical protein